LCGTSANRTVEGVPDTPPPPDTSSTVVLLIAHGSRNPRAQAEHERLCIAVEQRAAEGPDPVPVRPAYLEIATPSIPDAIDAEVAAGASVIRLLPHFLSSGNHVTVDLPAIAAEARAHHPGVTVELAEHLGADPGLVDLLVRRAVG
jgi:sirohydrochlorin cobaltochelatase